MAHAVAKMTIRSLPRPLLCNRNSPPFFVLMYSCGITRSFKDEGLACKDNPCAEFDVLSVEVRLLSVGLQQQSDLGFQCSLYNDLHRSVVCRNKARLHTEASTHYFSRCGRSSMGNSCTLLAMTSFST